MGAIPYGMVGCFPFYAGVSLFGRIWPLGVSGCLDGTYVVQSIKIKKGHQVPVYDVTMAYLEGPVVNKLGLFKGHPPSEVHFHVRRVKAPLGPGIYFN
jgi:hypothetical protein